MKKGFNKVISAGYVINYFDVGDNKVRDHCHITGKYRCSAHCSCNIILKLTRKVLVIFHNLQGFDRHLIMQKIGKFDVKVSVISNGLEKYMALPINEIFFLYWQHLIYELWSTRIG